MFEANAIPTRNTAWIANLSAQTLPFLTFLVATPLVVAGLGGDDYGRLVIFSLFPQILSQFDLGLATSAVRLTSQAMNVGLRTEVQRALWSILAVGVAVGAALGTLFYFARVPVANTIGLALRANSGGDTIDLEFAFVALTVFIGFASIPFSACLRSAGRLRFVAIIQSASGVLFWLAAVIVAHRGGSVAHILAVGTGLAALCWALQAVAAWRLLSALDSAATPDGPSQDQPNRRREYFDLAAFSAQITSLVTYHADKLIISAFVSPAAAGAYSICANIAGKLLVLASAISAYSFPHAARLHAANAKPLLRELQNTGTTTVVTVSSFLVIPALGLSEAFLRMWMGSAFAQEYSNVLRLLLCGYALASFSTISSSVAYAVGRSDICAKFAALGGLLTLSTCFLLVQPLGTIGAAIAALLGMTQAVWFSRTVSKILGQSMANYWCLHKRLITVAICVTAALLLIEDWIQSWAALLPVGLLGVCGCLGLWFVLRYATPEQVDVMQRLLEKFRQFNRKD